MSRGRWFSRAIALRAGRLSLHSIDETWSAPWRVSNRRGAKMAASLPSSARRRAGVTRDGQRQEITERLFRDEQCPRTTGRYKKSSAPDVREDEVADHPTFAARNREHGEDRIAARERRF